MNIILADHQRIFRVGIVCLLASEDDVRVVGQPANSSQLVRGIECLRPHVVVMSSAFLGGIQAIAAACERNGTALVLLRDFGAPTSYAGDGKFDSILERNVGSDTLLRELRRVARDGKLSAERGCPAGLPLPQTDPIPTRRKLTAHEVRIVRFVVQGYRNRDIAEALQCSEQSIKNTLSKVFAKMGVFGRLELALQMVHEGTLRGSKPTVQTVSPPRAWVEQYRWRNGIKGTTIQ